MNRNKLWSLASALSVAAIIGATVPAVAATPDYLFVGDYISSQLYKVDTSGNIIGGGAFIAGGFNIKEGVHGTANTLITVTGTPGAGNTITRFTDAGVKINDLSHPGEFNNIGNIAITDDAKYVYVPDEGANKLFRVNVATGRIVNTVNLSGAHDVAIGKDGSVYAAGYRGNTGVVRYNADLTGKTQLTAPGANGLTRPTGISVASDGSLYVMQNSGTAPGGGSDSIYHIGTSNTNFGQVIGTPVTSSLLKFSFGTDFGPDGNLYIATIGDFKGPGSTGAGSDPSYHDGVYVYNPGTGGVTSFIKTGAYNPATGDDMPGPGGIAGPKYVKWSYNFASAEDPGYSLSTPEPAGWATGGVFAMLLGAVLLRSRRRGEKSPR